MNNIDIKKTPIPYNIFLMMTEECNMRCTYCFETNRTKGFITTEVIDKVFEYFYINNIKTPSITFFGGEPTLCVDKIIYTLDKLSDGINSGVFDSFSSSIITNGLIYSDELSKKISELYHMHKSNAYIHLQISSSFTKETHNKTRLSVSGKDTYDVVYSNAVKYSEMFDVILKENIELTEKNINKASIFNIHPVITEDDVSESYKMYQEITKLGASCWIVPLTEEKSWSNESLLILEEQLNMIMSDLYKDCLLDGDSKYKFSNISKMLKDMSSQNINVGEELYRPCGFQVGLMSVMSNGDINQCHRMRYTGREETGYIGNILHDSPEEIIKNNLSKVFMFSDDGNEAITTDGKKCSECKASESCYVCPALNYTQNGEYNVVSSKQCSVNIKIHDVLTGWFHKISEAINNSQDVNNNSSLCCTDTEKKCNCNKNKKEHILNDVNLVILKSLEETQEVLNNLVQSYNYLVDYVDFLNKKIDNKKLRKRFYKK